MTEAPHIGEGEAEAPPARLRPVRGRRTPLSREATLVPLIIGAALMMQTLNATVMSNALPTMARSLAVDPLRLNLAITAYLLAAAVFLPVSGWLADRYGAKRVFLAAIVLYAASSLACGAAHSLWQLVAARLFQGMAGAMLMPVGRLVLLRTVPKAELIQAMAVLTMPSLLGPVIGPPLGGFIVTFGSWRWIFLINLPIAALGVWLVARHIPDVKDEAAPRRLDLIGTFLTGMALAAVIFGFENLGRDALPPVAVAGVFAAALALGGAYVWHSRRTPHAILDLSLFRIQTFRASVVGGGFMRIAVGATPFMLAMLLQVGFGFSALEAGLLTFTSAVGALAMKTVAPPMLRAFGFKPVLLANAFLVAGSFLAVSLIEADWPKWAMIAVLLTGGFLRSLQFTSLNGLAFADIDQPLMSRATTMSSMMQQLVQSIGIGLAASLMQLLMVRAGETHLTAAVVAPAFMVVGAVSLVSVLFFVGLPRTAGDELNGRSLA